MDSFPVGNEPPDIAVRPVCQVVNSQGHPPGKLPRYRCR